MKPIFTVKDFEPVEEAIKHNNRQRMETDAFGIAQTAVWAANAKIQKLIETWPMVYGFEEEGGTRYFSTEPQCKSDTHSARLAFIEELPKEECKHEPIKSRVTEDWFCDICGAELVAEWKAKP